MRASERRLRGKAGCTHDFTIPLRPAPACGERDLNHAQHRTRWIGFLPSQSLRQEPRGWHAGNSASRCPKWVRLSAPCPLVIAPLRKEEEPHPNVHSVSSVPSSRPVRAQQGTSWLSRRSECESEAGMARRSGALDYAGTDRARAIARPGSSTFATARSAAWPLARNTAPAAPICRSLLHPWKSLTPSPSPACLQPGIPCPHRQRRERQGKASLSDGRRGLSSDA